MKSAIGLLLVLLSVCETASTCSVAYHLQPVASDFVAAVSHQGKPIPNAEVRVIRGADDLPPVFTAKTNAGGSVKIEGLQPCGYYLVAAFNEIEAGESGLKLGELAKR